jgi:hypothetical protein
VGKEEYVKVLLNALGRIFMTKGLFHQMMHQTMVIYDLFYGAFLQALQVHGGVKRVTGNPLKGNFQSHEKFLLKVLRACHCCFMREFIFGLNIEEVTRRENESKIDVAKRLVVAVDSFFKSWLVSANKPSKLVALFMKVMSSYMRCKNGIKHRDFWLLEKESCDWLPFWKDQGKKDYLRIQCEFIEKVYNDTKISAFERELM